MTTNLTFREVPSNLAPLRFSRQPTMLFRLHKEGKAPSVDEVREIFSANGKDSCLVFPTPCLPDDIRSYFLKVENLRQRGSLGRLEPFRIFIPEYFKDLKRYCDNIGLLSLLEYNQSGIYKPKSGFTLESAAERVDGGIPLESPLSHVFGEDATEINKGTIFAAINFDNAPQSTLAICLILAHELAHAKLGALLAQFNLPADFVSENGREFYSYAYVYNFALFFLISQVQMDPLEDQEKIVAASMLRSSYDKMMHYFDQLPKLERKRFTLATVPGLPFGMPVLVDINPSDRTTFTRL
jgi:hypothetical protein